MAGRLDQLELRVRVSDLAQVGLRGGVDRDHLRLRPPRPLEHLVGRLAVEGADLDHRLRADRVEAAEEDLGDVRERGGVLVGIRREEARRHFFTRAG